MMHKGIVIAVVVVIGGWAVAKTTAIGSYAGTLWSEARSALKGQVSTKFELQRARHEIAQLDKDISGAIRPIAEYKAALQQLDKDIRQGQINVAERRDALLRLTKDLENRPTFVVFGGKQVSFDRAKAALDRDFEGFQRLEKHLDNLTKLHDTKQQSLDAAQEQLAKLISKKREYSLRVAQLETEEETLQIASLGNKMAVDDNRASAIEAALADIEQRHSVRRVELELAAGDLVCESKSGSHPDLAAIRTHLERTAPKE